MKTVADPTIPDPTVQQPKLPDSAATQPAKVAPLPVTPKQPDQTPTQPTSQAPTADPYAFTPITDASGTDTTSPTAAPLAVPHANDVTPSTPVTPAALSAGPVGGSGGTNVDPNPAAAQIAPPVAQQPYGTPAGPVQYDADGNKLESVWNPATQSFAYKGSPESTAGPSADALASEVARTQGIINDPTSSGDIVSLEKQRLAQLQGSNPGAMYGDQSGATGSWQANNASPLGGVAPQTDGGVIADQMAQENRWLGSAQAARAADPLPQPTGYSALQGGYSFTDPAAAAAAKATLDSTGQTIFGSDNAPAGGTAPPPGSTGAQQSAALAQLGIPTSPAAPNGPSVGGTPSSPAQVSSAPTSQLGAAISGTPANSASPNAGVGLTATDPNNPLTSQTITPNNTVDRIGLEQQNLNSTIKNVLDPFYGAQQTALNRTNFGAGRGVSGMARTSQGNLASDEANQVAQLANTGITGATTGSIQDMYNNLGIAQQQQQFQSGQEQTAFNQAAEQAQLNDALTNSAFGRALQQSTAGNANDPSQIALILSSIFGNQAGAAGQSAAGAFNQAGQNSVSDPTAAIKAYLKTLGIG